MKFIKFVLSTKKEWTFPEEIAKQILSDSRQLYPIIEADGKFHARTINKAHIIDTDFDLEAEKRYLEEQREKTLKLNLPKEVSEEQAKKNRLALKKMKKELISKKVIKK